MRAYAIVIPCFLALLSMERCARPAAIDPEPGDLKGAWRINLGQQRSFGQGTPLLAELRLENTSENPVYLPSEILPQVSGSADPFVWSLLEKWPRRLRAGETCQVLWSIETEPAPGGYTLDLSEVSAALLEVPPLDFTVESWQASELLRDYYASLRGHYERNGGPILQTLKDKAADPNAPPSVHLQLAELLESTGKSSEAKSHYRTFADQTFGADNIPGWLLAKLEEE